MPDRISSEPLDRSFSLSRDTVNEEERTVELAFSSEEPVERWFGIEVLNHSRESVDLSRLENKAALLVNHDRDDQVGVVLTSRIDDDRRGRAVVKFSRSARGDEIFQDVLDGIRTLVSVAYSVDEYEVTERKGEPDNVLVTRWTPSEISIVAVPADYQQSGIGRSKPENTFVTEEKNMSNDTVATDTTPATQPTTVDVAAETNKIRTAETRRIEAIRSIADEFDGLEDMSRQAIAEGVEVGDFNRRVAEELGRQNAELRQAQTVDNADTTLGPNDAKQFSFVRLMDAIAAPEDRAAQSRAGLELEICAEATAKLPAGYNVRGTYVPPSIMYSRDLTVGLDGDLVGTDHRGESFIDVLRNNMVAMQAGVQVMSGLVGNVDIPRQTAGASATWITAEDGDATESEPTFDSVTVTPKDLAVYTEVTRRLRQQSAPAVEGLVRRDLAMAIALGLDSAIYYGSGASGQPQGIDGATGVDDPTFSVATAPTYAELLTQMKTMMTANAASGLTYIGSPDFWESMMNTPKQGSGVEGNFISNGETILGRQFLVSSQLAADDFVLGNFNSVILAEWGGYELNVDPYTSSLKGKVRYVVFKTCDIGIRHPEQFSFHNAA